MDPNATLKMIEEFLVENKRGPEVDEWCQDLHDWLQKGGFTPSWKDYPLATEYYDVRMITIEEESAYEGT